MFCLDHCAISPEAEQGKCLGNTGGMGTKAYALPLLPDLGKQLVDPHPLSRGCGKIAPPAPAGARAPSLAS